MRAGGLFTRSAAAVLDAAEAAGVSRLVWLSSFGVGHTLPWSSATQKAVYRTLLRSLCRADVAAFMHRAAHDDEWIHRSPVISG